MTIRATALLCASLAAAASAARAEDAPPPAMAPAPGLQAEVQGLFGKQFKILGPASLVAPDQTLKYRFKYDEVILASVPVAYGKTARLDSDVEFQVPEYYNNRFAMAKGETLFETRFHAVNAESTTRVTWCGLATEVIKKKIQQIFCLSPNDEGKTVAILAAQNSPYGLGFTFTAGPGAVPWFAFGLTGDASKPIDNPVITETDMPSPDMAIVIRLEQPDFNKKTSSWEIISSWALRGPKNGTPTTGQISYIKANMPGSDKVAGTVALTLPTETLRVDYDPDSHLLSHARLEPRDLPPIPVAALQPSDDPAPATAEPAITSTAWRIGVLDIELGSVTVKSGPLHKNDTLLTGRARLSPRQKLNKAIDLDGVLGNKVHVPAGAFAHPAELVTYDATGAAMKFRNWCFDGAFGWGLQTFSTVCLPQKGGLVTGAGLYKKDWEFNAFEAATMPVSGVVTYDLSPAPDPAPAEEQLEFRVTYLSKTGIELKLGLVRDGQFGWHTAYSEAWDGDGTARLYLWDRVILLHHQDDTVTAEVQSSDKGRSPAYGMSRNTQHFW